VTDAAAPGAAPAAAPPATKAPAKRKRENRYKNAPPAVLSRRRAQNRASQRAYRERKDQRIRDLETELSTMRTDNESCKMQMAEMRQIIMSTRVGNSLPGANVPPQQRTVSMSAMPSHVQMMGQHGQGMHNGHLVNMPPQQMPMNGMVSPSSMMAMQQQMQHMQQGYSIPPQSYV
jgi:hypothetical protein